MPRVLTISKACLLCSLVSALAMPGAAAAQSAQASAGPALHTLPARVTLGLELFASTIGLHNTDVLIGIGITVGAWEYGTLAIAASRRARRLPVASGD